MAIQNTFYLDVDIKRDNYVDEPKVTQNDAVTFVLRMTDDGVDYPLAGVSTYTLASLRPDGQSVLTVGTLTGVNEITFELGSTEVSVPGNVKAAIQLYDVDGRVSSIPFTYEVTKDIATGYIPSKEEKTLIELVLGQGPAILAAAQAATITANDAAANADAKAALASAEAQDANAAGIYARDKGLLAEQKAALADASANEADTATYNAENATQEAQDATNAINAILPNVEGLENRGEYNSATTYVKNNLVERNGSSWQALQDTVGNQPPTLPTKSNAYWTLISQRGVDGMGAVSTVNGEGPDVNGNVLITIPDPDLSGLATKAELQTLDNKVENKIDKDALYVDIRDFGAIGDGFVDNTVAIQNALNVSSGKTVLIPNGEFLYTTTLNVPPSVSIMGVGNGSILRPQSCDALNFEVSDSIGPVRLSGFWIYGNGCDTNTAIRVMGDAHQGRTTGLVFENVYISWYGTGMHFRSLWHSSIRDCILTNVYTGMRFVGQSVKNIVDGCKITRGSLLVNNGESESRGIVVDSAFDYNPNGNSEKRPEDLQVHRSLVFGFDVAVDHQRCLFASYKNNDFDYCYKVGFRFQQSDGNLEIEGNWIAVYDNAKRAIFGQPLSAYNTDNISIKNNKIGGANLSSGSSGIVLMNGQSNILIENNNINGFTESDILLDNAGLSKIIRNNCRSVNLPHSISITSSVLGVSVSENYVEKPIYCHPTSNERIDFGYTYKGQSTYLEGKSILLAGTKTVTTLYSSLIGSPPQFIDSSPSHLPAYLINISVPSNLGNVWGTASNESVTIGVETAPSVDTTLRWTVKAFSGTN